MMHCTLTFTVISSHRSGVVDIPTLDGNDSFRPPTFIPFWRYQKCTSL